MIKLWQGALIVAAVSILAVAAVQLNGSPAHSQSGKVPVPPMCQDSNIQIPTRNGLEWKQLIVCPND